MNDIIAALLGLVGIGLLVFSFVWYEKTIKLSQDNDNQPVIMYREIK